MRLIEQLIFGLVTRWTWRQHPKLTADFVDRNGQFPVTGFPRTGNEKFLWRKLFDHDPRFTILSDKLACKAWVAQRLPALAHAEVLWRGTDVLTIPESTMQEPVVFKANHSWRTNHFIRNGQVDRHELRALGQRWLDTTHGARGHQWGYFDIPRELFIEREIQPGPDGLDELKLYTFGERITRVVHISGRFDTMRANVWVPDGKGALQRSEHRAAVAPPDPSRPLPARIDQALQMARHLGREFDHLRVDLLWDRFRLWFGELTVYNLSGRFPGEEGTDPDAVSARAWDLRRSAFLRQPPRRGWRGFYARALRRALNGPHHGPLPPLLQRLAKPLPDRETSSAAR